jgi:hypothetical protein
MKLLFILAVFVVTTNKVPITYTVKVGLGNPMITFTNVVEFPTNHTRDCILIKFADYGETNEFHAWCVPLILSTNK